MVKFEDKGDPIIVGVTELLTEMSDNVLRRMMGLAYAVGQHDLELMRELSDKLVFDVGNLHSVIHKIDKIVGDKSKGGEPSEEKG